MSLLVTLIFISIAVLLHEFGHFIVAKRSGVKIEEFGIGFPPRILKLGKWGDVEFTLNAIPFGGFVRLAGEDDPSVEGGFAVQPKRVRVAVLLAGAAMNVLLGFLLFTSAFLSGAPEPLDQVAIYEVAPGSPAEKAGLHRGDIVLAVDGHELKSPGELSEYTHQHLGQEITLLIKRGDESFEVKIVPRVSPPEGEGPMGVEIGYAIRRGSIPWYKAILNGGTATIVAATSIVVLPVMAIKGLIPAGELRPIGPVGVTKVATSLAEHSAQQGWWFSFLFFLGFLSVALAVANLLPLPGLDGGRILFVVIEAIRGRRVDARYESWAHTVGFVLLLALMLVITVADIAIPINTKDIVPPAF